MYIYTFKLNCSKETENEQFIQRFSVYVREGVGSVSGGCSVLGRMQRREGENNRAA